MSFKIAARTILQLGAELISSDSIAFYELIKNSFDAGSPHVDIDVVVRIEHDSYIAYRKKIISELEQKRNVKTINLNINKYRKEILKDIDRAAPDAGDLKKEILEADTWRELLEVIDEANYIRIEDSGSGMSMKDLDDIYLTIGTRTRLKAREARKNDLKQSKNRPDSRPILGEKGIGRLSVMRLGSLLWVKTTKKDEEKWNELEINWSLFSNDSDELIDTININPTEGLAKRDKKTSGTILWISALTSSWTKEKLEQIAADEFSKLSDPFTLPFNFKISLHYNNEVVKIPRFDKILLKSAHAKVTAQYDADDIDEPILVGKVDYSLRNKEKTFSLDIRDLRTITKGISPSSLKSVGSFNVVLYWFNRQILQSLDDVFDRRRIQKLVAALAGGLMVFRDGFRVYPYGNPDDDWLDLDKKALASAGYKVNRRQIIGKVDISSIENVALVDQTNREGLRDCDEKRILIMLLQHIIESEFRAFLNTVDKEVQAQIPITFEDLEERVETEEKRINKSLKILKQNYPEVTKDKQIFSSIEDAIDKIRTLMEEAQTLADSFKSGHTELLNLAGLGLMVEIVAHELNRATRHTLKTLADRDSLIFDEEDIGSIFDTLETQLKTLQKRLRILDPMSTSGRQVKEKFDLISLIKEILLSHEAQFIRHNIKYSIDTIPRSTNKGFSVKMVKGMIAQIMENLLSNSVYWLKEQKRIEKSFSPEILVTVDVNKKAIYFVDNGPGVPPSRKEEIFQPFVTTKPPGEGKGLGLYISREIAKYHGASIYMSEKTTMNNERLNTFILSLEN